MIFNCPFNIILYFTRDTTHYTQSSKRYDKLSNDKDLLQYSVIQISSKTLLYRSRALQCNKSCGGNVIQNSWYTVLYLSRARQCNKDLLQYTAIQISCRIM